MLFKYIKMEEPDGPGPYFVWTVSEEGDGEWVPIMIFTDNYQIDEDQEWFVKVPRPEPLQSIFHYASYYPAFSDGWVQSNPTHEGTFNYAKVNGIYETRKERIKEGKWYPKWFWRHECPKMGDPGWTPFHMNMPGTIDEEWDYFLAIPDPPDPFLLEEKNA